MSEDLPMKIWVNCTNCNEPIRITLDWDSEKLVFTAKAHILRDS